MPAFFGLMFMNIAILVLLVCCVLPILCSWISGYYRHKQLGVVDNKIPRLQNAQLTGVGARAVAAQHNAWEALAVYSAALLALNMAAVPVEKYTQLCLIFMIMRIMHAIFYMLNWDALRSIAYLVGYGICMYFLVLSL